MLTALPISTVDDLRGKRVLVLGLGSKGGGVEAARWLVRHGAVVTASDLKSAADLAESLAALSGFPITFHLGRNDPRDVDASDLVLRNPSVRLDAPILRYAAQRGVPVVMDTTFIFQFCPAPIAGITGTRGKSTTTAVAGEVLRRSRSDTVVSGNIVRSALADLDRITASTPVILELSSWQLEGMEPIRRSPHWAVLTSILPDHLNRYSSMEAYIQSKETIVRYQRPGDVAALPLDDPAGARFAALTPGKKEWFGQVPESRMSNLESGLFRRGEDVVLGREGKEQVLLRWEELGGRGDHTKRNMLAGALLALEMGAPFEDAVRVLREFRGIPNRLEVIREHAGRTFVNDTTATTPDAVIAALQSFPGKRMVLITGGTDKNLDYRGLTSIVAGTESLHALVLLAGSATEKLRAELSAAGGQWSTVAPVRTMAEAVHQAWKASQPGDVVLLSPGAASFELFRDEFDRGEQFREVVFQLAS